MIKIFCSHFSQAGLMSQAVGICLQSSSFLACTTTSAQHHTIRRHQPPQRAALGLVDCFVQCEVVGSQIMLDTRTPQWSLPVTWWGSHQNHLGICVIIHTCNMPRYGKTLSVDYCCVGRLLSYPPHLVIAIELVLFDFKHHSQAPLINSINPACIHLAVCPAFRSVQKDWQDTSVIQFWSFWD